VRVVFNTETGAPNGTMRGDRGTYSTRTEVLESWGNVVVTFVDGRTMKSPHVIYKRSANDISSDTTFEITGPKGRYGGIGVSFDPGFTRFACKRNCGGSSAVVLPNR
jgi:Lipopolysaccharide-assembly, LptC-related